MYRIAFGLATFGLVLLVFSCRQQAREQRPRAIDEDALPVTPDSARLRERPAPPVKPRDPRDTLLPLLAEKDGD